MKPFANVYRPAPRPDVGYTLIPGFRGKAYGQPLRVNDRGFRGPSWREEPEENGIRIALLGDSHAFGFGVAYEDTVAARLARRLEEAHGVPVEVLDFGVPGYNSRQQLAVWRHHARKYRPDLVVLMPCNNDDQPALVAGERGWLRRGRDVVAPREDVALARIDGTPLVHSKLLVWLAVLWARATAPGSPLSGRDEGPWMPPVQPGPVPEALRTSVYEPLAAIVAEARASGTGVVLAPFAAPMPWRRTFARLAGEHDLPVVELLGLFPEVPGWHELVREYGIGGDPHLGPRAHDRWARALAGTIAGMPAFRAARGR